MNRQSGNRAIYTDQGRDLLPDHYLTKYLSDLGKPDEKRFHRLNFGQIIEVRETYGSRGLQIPRKSILLHLCI